MNEERAEKTNFHRESNSGTVTGSPVHSPLSHDSQLKISLPTLSHIQPGGTQEGGREGEREGGREGRKACRRHNFFTARWYSHTGVSHLTCLSLHQVLWEFMYRFAAHLFGSGISSEGGGVGG